MCQEKLGQKEDMHDICLQYNKKNVNQCASANHYIDIGPYLVWLFEDVTGIQFFEPWCISFCS